MKKKIAIAAILLLGLFLAYFFEPNSYHLEQASTTKTKNIHFYMQDIESRSFTKEGIHNNTLITPYAVEFQGEGKIRMKKPQLHIGFDKSTWLADANEGITSANLKKITLSDSVTIARADGMADIHTERLVFDSTDEVAYTLAPVKIFARGSQTMADGIHIDLNHEVIKLKNNVRTYYAP